MGIHALGPNAVVVLSGEVWSSEAAEALRCVVSDDVVIVGVESGASLHNALVVLDEETMRAHGWVRA